MSRFWTMFTEQWWLLVADALATQTPRHKHVTTPSVVITLVYTCIIYYRQCCDVRNISLVHYRCVEFEILAFNSSLGNTLVSSQRTLRVYAVNRQSRQSWIWSAGPAWRYRIHWIFRLSWKCWSTRASGWTWRSWTSRLYWYVLFIHSFVYQFIRVLLTYLSLYLHIYTVSQKTS